MKRWKVTIKEVGTIKPIVTYHHGYLNYNEVRDFFGCEEADVEWYNIEEEK